ncbi:TetR/AcrR family transcriptional regulator [Pseudonocardia sp. CA-142604]|uniref:TetR/AcrR family transcriptional regulator n=1 Tax=Pseudonocardia sp. CA-142604 TaxID=3240024 RepID=UPI003D8A8672
MESEVIWLRPEKSGVGRPAQRSRAEITEAAVRLADRSGLDAVSMRQVAAEIGTGAGSLYRYVDTRDDLIDLMADHVSGEYELGTPTGDWLGDLVEVGLQAREIYRRHPWMADLAISHPVVGPNAIEVIEHVLAVLADHPVSDGDKLIAFAMLNAVVASVAQNELSPTDRSAGARRYVAHVAAEGKHPHLAALEFPSPPTEDPFPEILRRVLSGLLA